MDRTSKGFIPCLLLSHHYLKLSAILWINKNWKEFEHMNKCSVNQNFHRENTNLFEENRGIKQECCSSPRVVLLLPRQHMGCQQPSPWHAIHCQHRSLCLLWQTPEEWSQEGSSISNIICKHKPPKHFVQSYDSMMTKILAPSHDSRFLQWSWLSYLKVGLCRLSDENPKVGTSKKGSASTEHVG